MTPTEIQAERKFRFAFKIKGVALAEEIRRLRKKTQREIYAFERERDYRIKHGLPPIEAWK